jgi:D-sedoheptulose 7-phosphate isomerase
VPERAELSKNLRIALQETAEMHALFDERCSPILADIAILCADTIHIGGRLFFCGNGGSAAESQHLATELVVRLSADKTRPALPAMALTTDTSTLTACSNDFGFDAVFARQVEAHLRKGDILFLLSTSGRSPNLIEAAKASHEKYGVNIGLLGNHDTPLDEHLDIALHIPSDNAQRVQEAHLLCGHLIIQSIESQLQKHK